MKRRSFVTTLVAAPAAAPALFAQQAAPATPVAPAQPPAAAPGRGGGGRGGGTAQDIKLEVVSPDNVAEPETRFFTPAQFAALRKLSDLLMPPMRGNPGALDAAAPEFLDFLIGVSAADRQTLYRNGLDALNAKAKKQFNKSFGDLDAAQCDAVIRPLLVPVPWTHEPPKDPLQHFMTAVHDDIRTATRNSREWNTSGGRRGGGQLFWNAVDPVYKG
jgi:hypothetical protein